MLLPSLREASPVPAIAEARKDVSSRSSDNLQADVDGSLAERAVPIVDRPGADADCGLPRC